MYSKTQLADKVARLYIRWCTTEPLYYNKKISKRYFGLKKHFLKDDENTLEQLFRFLETRTKSFDVSLSEVYRAADEFNKQRIKERDKKEMKSITLSHDEPYSLDLLMSL